MRPVGMKIFMTGGTGFVGSLLTRGLTASGHDVTILTRSASVERVLPERVNILEGNPGEGGPWQNEVAKHSVVINLAGASIFSRWTKKSKKAIRDSRILSTRNLVEALAARSGRETLLFSTSGVGYYGAHGDEELDEDSPPGDGFLAAVTGEWEAEALKARAFGARVFLCRFGMVLGTGGGAFARMAPMFRWCLGSRLGNGKQWVSWIHGQDLVNGYLFLMGTKDVSGPINFTAPDPVTNREMTGLMGEALKRPILMPPVPGFMVRLFAGEFGSLLLEGQRVVPRALLNKGFQFQFPSLGGALTDLVR
jgi:uncharacterized protein (TIGR01777 family)